MSRPCYRDFVIQLGARQASGHEVRVRSPAGEWVGRIDLPLPGAAPPSSGGRWRDVRRPAAGAGEVGPGGRVIGENLFRALFCEPVRGLFDRSSGCGPAAALRVKLEIELSAESGPLLDLPWELLCSPDRGRFLGLSRLTPIVRYLDTGAPVDSLPLASPLRILAVVSQPKGLPHLDLERERRAMETLWEREGAIEVVWLEGADLIALRGALLRTEFHVVHFMGHGGGERGGGAVLFLTDRRGAPEAVRGAVLAAMLADFRALRLVFLNSCQGAALNGHGTAAGLAAALVAAGVPAVLAIRGPIADRLAIELSAAFYRRIAAGDPVDVAAAEGRLAMFAAQPEGWEWASAALFMRSADGRLFDPGDEDRADDSWLQPYLRGVVEQCSFLELPGAAAEGAGGKAVALDDLYLAADCEGLDTTPPIPLSGAAEEDGLPALASVLRRQGLLVVIGEPGGGKSTLLRWLALHLARARLRGDERVCVAAAQIDPEAEDAGVEVDLAPSLVPLLVTASSLAAAGRAGQAAHPPRLARLLARGHAALLVDGFDELRDAVERRAVAREVAEVARNGRRASAQGSGPLVIVATRPATDLAMLFGTEVERVRLRPLGRAALARFCALWARAVPALGVAGRTAGETELLAALLDLAFPRGVDGGQFAITPMIATILALVFWRHPERPLRPRARLYHAAIDLMLERWMARGDSGCDPPSAATARRILLADLACLAAELEAMPGAQAFGRERLEELSHRLLADRAGGAPCSIAGVESGLLVRRVDGLFGFTVPAFQEYFAGCWLAAHGIAAVPAILQRLGVGGWEGPILLALGRLSLDLQPAGLGELLERLIASDDSFAARLPRGALLVAQALPELAEVPGGIVGRVSEVLLAAYVSSRGTPLCAVVANPIGRAFSQLLRGEHAALVEGLLRDRLDLATTAGLTEACALAELLRSVRIYPAALLTRFAASTVPPGPQEAPAWQEAIDGLLRQASAERAVPLENRRALRCWLERHPMFRARLMADGTWRRLVLAVYGGLEQGRFQVAHMHRDSPLSPILIDALAADRPAAALVSDLCRVWRRTGDDAASLDAMLALMALGEDIQSELSARPALVARFASRLALVRHAMADGVAASAPGLLAGLEKMAAGCPAQHLADLAAVITARAGTSGRLQVELLNLMQRAAGSQAGSTAGAHASIARNRLAGLVWRHELALRGPSGGAGIGPGSGGGEVYRAAVLLDVAGGLLAPSSMELAQCLAAAHFDAGGLDSGVLDGRLTPRPKTRAMMAAVALDALDAIAEPIDFVRGWALEQLAPLLAETGMLGEGLVAALGSLSERFEARAAAVRALLPAEDARLRLLDEPDPFPDLVREVVTIADGWTRFRAFRRLLLCFRGRGAAGGPGVGAGGPDLEAAAAAAARTIDEPELRTWALTQLALLATRGPIGPAEARTLPPSAGSHSRRDDARCAARLREPEARARAFGRLAAVDRPERAERWLTRALRAAVAIVDRRQRAETLAGLEGLCACRSRMQDRWRRGVDDLDAWERALLTGRHTALLLRYAPSLEQGGADTAPITLQALAEDVLGLLGSSKPAGRPIRAGEREHAFAPHPGLDQAVSCQLEARTLACLLDDLEGQDAERRSAAALALHGDRSASLPGLSVARLGTAAVAVLARRWLDTREDRPQVAQVIGWVFERLQHDDGAALSGWLQCADRGGPRGEEALVILGHLGTLAANVWEVVCVRIGHAAPEVRRALLLSLCRLLARRRVPEWVWQEIAPVLPALGEAAAPLTFLPDGPLALVESALEVLALADGRSSQPDVAEPAGSRVAAAEFGLARRFSRLQEVVGGDPETAREMLARAGDVHLDSIRAARRLRAAVERLERSPAAVDLLIEWLDARLGLEIQDAETCHPINRDLLALVSALAERWPEVFCRRGAALPSLSNRLRDAVELHDSFVGRRSALGLLAALQRVTTGVLAALRAAARDVAEVQTAALLALGSYRTIDPACLADLFAALEDPDVVVAHAASGLLAGLATQGCLSLEVRDRAVRAVADALALPSAGREVRMLVRRDRAALSGRPLAPRVCIEREGCLADSFARALLALAGFGGRRMAATGMRSGEES
jgi:hypothetical protein